VKKSAAEARIGGGDLRNAVTGGVERKMDTRRPHEIRHMTPEAVRAAFRDPIERRRWLPLTEDEATMLGAMDEDGRAHWFASLSRQEKRARFRAAEKQKSLRVLQWIRDTTGPKPQSVEIEPAGGGGA
jgi:hypothetical protein